MSCLDRFTSVEESLPVCEYNTRFKQKKIGELVVFEVVRIYFILVVIRKLIAFGIEVVAFLPPLNYLIG